MSVATSSPTAAGADLLEHSDSLDSMLVTAALGPLRNLLPGASTARWAASLAGRPVVTARRLRDLGTESARILVGTSSVAPPRGDRRFTDSGWTQNPVLRRLVQVYLSTGATIDDLVDAADLNPRDRKRVRFFLENVVEACSPSNVPLVNPASAKAAIDTAGLSLVRGGKQLATDLATAPRVPEMVDVTGFEVGENIAATPGAVVLRTDVFELIQYTPQTEQVYQVPMLIVPPTINKYYAIDLAPGRSMIEHGLQEGRQMFVMSWRNPDARHADWGFDTYARAILDGLDAVEEITGSAATVLGGLCSGGILATSVAGYLAAVGRQDRLAALFLAVTVIDQAGAGTVSAFANPHLLAQAKRRSADVGYLDGRSLAEMFAWLRPRDLIWNYWVNNYLLGKRPPSFDILFWNADTTRMSAALHADFLDLAQANALTRAGGVTVLGVPIDLAQITVDSYVVAGIADHITPWQNCYRTTGLLGGTTRFVLSNSGHVAALVNPPGNPKSSYHVNDSLSADPQRWLAGAQKESGSWWTDVSQWLATRCGPLTDAPTSLGGTRLTVLDEAPGTYVYDR